MRAKLGRPMRLRWVARRHRLRWILATTVVVASIFAAISLVAQLVAAAVP